MKWSEVKGFWITEEIEYLQEYVLESYKLIELKWSELKWSEVKGFWITEEIEYFQKQDLESYKWIEVKSRELIWSEDQLNAVKWKEIRRGLMWSVCKCSEVEWYVGLGEMCVIEYGTVWFTHYLVYTVVFNTDSSTSGSTKFWVLCIMCCGFFRNFSLNAVCYFMWCVVLYCIALYCILLHLLYCTVLYCFLLSCIVAHGHRV